MRRPVVSPAPRAEMRGDISGSDALPEFERTHGKIAWQKTGDRAQVSGAVRREIRVIWRKPDCLNPSLVGHQGPVFRPGGGEHPPLSFVAARDEAGGSRSGDRGEGGSSLDEVASAGHCRTGRVR